MPSMESTTVTVWAGVGSRHETPEINGISHFLEHMVFKGSTRYPSAAIISQTIDGLGAEFNAGTSKEYTNFYIKSRNGVVDTAFDVLSSIVLEPLLRLDDINRERGVIIEEIGMYEDTPSRHVFDLFERLIFSGNNLGRDIIGTRQNIKSISKKDFVNYRSKFYKPTNLLVTVAGGLTAKDAFSLAQKYFGGGAKAKSSTNYLESIKPFKSIQTKPGVLLSSQKREQANLIIGFLAGKRADKQRYTQAILATILGGGMSSRLFSEIREKRGLAYSVRTSNEYLPDTGYIQTYAGVDPNKAEEVIKIILDQKYGLASGKYPITDAELVKAKEFLKGHIALSLEETESINHFFGEEELIMGKVKTPEEVFENIDKVTSQQVVALAKKYFVKSSLNLAIIGPFKSKLAFEKLLG